MRIGEVALLVTMHVLGVAAATSRHASERTLDRMPAALEARFALSAAPPELRDRATVYLLDPRTGYQRSRQGTSGVTCLVQRTAWELVDFRDDLYIPLCYDAVGTTTYLQVIMDTAALRAQGMDATAVKAEIERRYRDRRYRAPIRAGVSYMLAPIFRTVSRPDMQVRTMAAPHVMFYAPYTTDADLGAAPNFGDHATLLHPFVGSQGNAEQTYIIQLTGDAEKARILADEKPLLDALCAYRDVLCLAKPTP